MAHEILLGLQVSDDALYTRYREAMAPMLALAGGAFRFDFQVAAVLKKQTEAPINRVFAIRFPDRAAKERFFTDPAYLAVRERFFTASVEAVTVLSEYEVP
ncbi:MAG TPA: DUF1330 domain-containing protein [Candidatus Methylacidiphilales bacterium]